MIIETKYSPNNKNSWQCSIVDPHESELFLLGRFVNSVSVLLLVIDLFVYVTLVCKSNGYRNDSIFQVGRTWVLRYDPTHFWILLLSRSSFYFFASLAKSFQLVYLFKEATLRFIDFFLKYKYLFHEFLPWCYFFPSSPSEFSLFLSLFLFFFKFLMFIIKILVWELSGLLILDIFCAYKNFVCMYVCVPLAFLVSPEVRKGNYILWNWSYRWL